MSDDRSQEGLDRRLVLLAALAFLHWRDTGVYPEVMAAEIDGSELAAALDRLARVSPTESE